MPTKTIFLAQAFHWVDGQLEPGRVYRYATSERAEAAGAALAGAVPGVAVYSLEGEVAADVWDDPRIIAMHGAAPSEAA